MPGEDTRNNHKYVDIRKGWLPLTGVAAVLCVVLPVAALVAADRQILHQTAHHVKEVEPRLRVVETRIEVQNETNAHIIRMLQQIDQRLERIEDR